MRKLLQHKTTILVGLLLLLAAFLRLYKIADYMTFLGDEGRDALIVKGILEGHFTLLGPRASAGDFFTGPIYYYMIAPFLWLFRLNPVGPAVFIALLGIATVFLVYFLGKKFFSERAGLFAAALYAVSPLVLAYSRSSWNPNPMPFFSLVIIYLVYLALKKPSWKKYLGIGILYGVALQLHYIELFFGIALGLMVFLGGWVVEKKIRWLELLKRYGELIGGFLIGFSPFLLFEVRHGFPNLRTIFQFIFVKNINASYTGGEGSFFAIVSNVFIRLFGRLITRFPPPDQFHSYSNFSLDLWQLAIILLAIASFVALFRAKNKVAALLIGLWISLGILFFGFYKKPIYDYYFEFMFPAPFLLIGNLLSDLYQGARLKMVGKVLSVSIFVFLFVFNLWGNPFRYPPNRQLNQMKTIAEFVLSKTDNKPFNFALITKGNSDHAYRYFFSLEHHDPVTIENTVVDPKRQTVTDQLLVVCEFPDCQPLGYPLWEVAGFGRAEIAGEWNVSVVKVYRLVHYKGEK